MADSLARSLRVPSLTRVESIAQCVVANLGAAGGALSSHAAMLMSFADATKGEPGFGISAAKQTLKLVHEAIADDAQEPEWLTNLEQSWEALHAGWDATPVLRDIPAEHRHRFVIDSDKLKHFDEEATKAGLDAAGSPYAAFLFTEPGYLLGVANAYKAASSSEGPLDAALIDKVHDAISDANPAMERGFHKGVQSSVHARSWFSEEAFSDLWSLLEELHARDGVSAFDLSPCDGVNWRTGSNPDTSAAAKGMIIDRWADDRDRALEMIGQEPSSAPMRAIAILDFLTKCNRLHAHADGNGRMYQQILLDRELYRAELPRSILPVPGNQHRKGFAEMLVQLAEGMADCAKYVPCEHPQQLQLMRHITLTEAQQYVQEYRDRYAWNANTSSLPTNPADDSDDELMLDLSQLPPGQDT